MTAGSVEWGVAVSVVELHPAERSSRSLAELSSLRLFDGLASPLDDRRAVPPFAALRAFEALGRTGGLRRAAQALGLNHGVVSRHIRALEAWTGVQLVERGGSGRGLTAAGASYHARLSAALFEVANATAELIGANDESRLSLWCAPGFASKWLSARLAGFEAANLDLEIELHPTDSSPSFERREADADIRYVSFGESLDTTLKGCRSIEIARPPVWAVASPELAVRLSATHAADLLEAPLLHEESVDQWRAWFAANDLHISQLPGPRLWNAHLAIEAARRGQGVALANSFLIEDDLAQGRLAVIDTGRPISLGAYIFIARSDQWTCSRIVRFRRWLQRSIADRPALRVQGW